MSEGKKWFKAQETGNTGDTKPLAEALHHLTFNDDGLIPVIAQCETSGVVLMMAWMNLTALQETLETGQLCYWSRSRAQLWRKGESSGHRQKLVSMHIDCDGDTLLAKVEQTGAACHTNRRDCFFWQVSPTTQEIHLRELDVKN
jgi:phosphoribosyl-AMP cyclohydrolase